MFLQGMIIQSEATVKKYCEKRLSTIITNIDEICILAMIVCVGIGGQRILLLLRK